MKKSMTKEIKVEEEKLKDAFVLWLHNSKSDKEYLSGITDESIGNSRLIGFFNTMKKNPKEPDIRVYLINEKGEADKEIADLWENQSKSNTKYLSGTTDEQEKIVGFYGNKNEEKRPYIRVYFN